MFSLQTNTIKKKHNSQKFSWYYRNFSIIHIARLTSITYCNHTLIIIIIIYKFSQKFQYRLFCLKVERRVIFGTFECNSKSILGKKNTLDLWKVYIWFCLQSPHFHFQCYGKTIYSTEDFLVVHKILVSPLITIQIETEIALWVHVHMNSQTEREENLSRIDRKICW